MKNFQNFEMTVALLAASCFTVSVNFSLKEIWKFTWHAGLKTREKLINLGSRNFYLCRKPTTVADSSCSNEAMIAAACAFPLTNFMDFLL